MSLPNFTAEAALYKTCGHYRASFAPIGASNVTVCQLPDGSYQQTCLGCFLSPPDGTGSQDLNCLCYDFNGGLVPTTLSGAVGGLGCIFDIWNSNGHLCWSCSAAILQRATALDTRRDCLNFRQLGWAWRVCQAPPTVLCQAFWKIWPCLGHIAFDRRSKERLSKLLAIVTGRVPCCGARAASILTLSGEFGRRLRRPRRAA